MGAERDSCAWATRPRLGLRPTRPQAAAGMRIEPPPSLAWAIGNAPAATSAAEPPEDAPHEYWCPRVERGRAVDEFGCRGEPERRHHRRAEHIQTGADELVGELLVLRRGPIGHRRRTVQGGDTGEVGVVLDDRGHPRNRPGGNTSSAARLRRAPDRRWRRHSNAD